MELDKIKRERKKQTKKGLLWRLPGEVKSVKNNDLYQAKQEKVPPTTLLSHLSPYVGKFNLLN